MTFLLFAYLFIGFIISLFVIRKELDDGNFISIADVIWYITGGMVIGLPMLLSHIYKLITNKK
jgi:hypothetical protein